MTTNNYTLPRLEGDWPSYRTYKTTWSLAQWWRFEPVPNHDVNLLRLWDFNRCNRASSHCCLAVVLVESIS